MHLCKHPLWKFSVLMYPIATLQTLIRLALLLSSHMTGLWQLNLLVLLSMDTKFAFFNPVFCFFFNVLFIYSLNNFWICEMSFHCGCCCCYSQKPCFASTTNVSQVCQNSDEHHRVALAWCHNLSKYLFRDLCKELVMWRHLFAQFWTPFTSSLWNFPAHNTEVSLGFQVASARQKTAVSADYATVGSDKTCVQCKSQPRKLLFPGVSYDTLGGMMKSESVDSDDKHLCNKKLIWASWN